jgi:type II secretory pathway pseudopilin PulG
VVSPVLPRAPRRSDDAGATLVELLAALAIMSIVLAVATSGIVRMYQTANATSARAAAQAQISTALLRLDREVRYAKGIGVPHTESTGQYVELLVAMPGGDKCVQLRVTGTGASAGGQVLQRSWTPSTTPNHNWAALATGVTSASPFSYVAPDDSVGFQRLGVQLTSVSGNGSARASKNSRITFTAHNTSRDTSTDTCPEWNGNTP